MGVGRGGPMDIAKGSGDMSGVCLPRLNLVCIGNIFGTPSEPCLEYDCPIRGS